MPESKYARRGRSSTLHVVTGVDRWYRGMTAVAECGVRQVDVLETPAYQNQIRAEACKRCLHSLGWDLVVGR